MIAREFIEQGPKTSEEIIKERKLLKQDVKFLILKMSASVVLIALFIYMVKMNLAEQVSFGLLNVSLSYILFSNRNAKLKEKINQLQTCSDPVKALTEVGGIQAVFSNPLLQKFREKVIQDKRFFTNQEIKAIVEYSKQEQRMAFLVELYKVT